MKMFLSKFEITKEELEGMLNDLDSEEVIELEEIDEYGNLHFTISKYGFYY